MASACPCSHKTQTTQPPATSPVASAPSASDLKATISEPSEDVIIIFEDSVSKEEIDEHVAKIISAGGKIKRPWYLERGGIMGNAFAATIPISCLLAFHDLKSVSGSGIKHIEADGKVTIQDGVGSAHTKVGAEVQPEAPSTQVA